jgi:hypothetical protein
MESLVYFETSTRLHCFTSQETVLFRLNVVKYSALLIQILIYTCVWACVYNTRAYVNIAINMNLKCLMLVPWDNGIVITGQQFKDTILFPQQWWPLAVTLRWIADLWPTGSIQMWSMHRAWIFCASPAAKLTLTSFLPHISVSLCLEHLWFLRYTYRVWQQMYKIFKNIKYKKR